MTFMLAACPWCGQPAKIRRVRESARDASGHARFNFVECSSTACAMMGPTCAAISAHDAHLDAVRDWIPGSHAYIHDAGHRAAEVLNTPRHPVEQG